MKSFNNYFGLCGAFVFYTHQQKHITNYIDLKQLLINENIIFFSNYDNCIIKSKDTHTLISFDSYKHFWEPYRKSLERL